MILWDRSRWERRNHCPRAAWHEYHGGRGKGLRPQRNAIPLAEGSGVHRANEGLLRACTEVRPDQDLANIIITTAGDEYEAGARAGLEGVETSQLDHVVREQRWLLECLAWACWRWYLPVLLGEYEIVAVEEEETYVVGCDCGVGEGEGEPEWVEMDAPETHTLTHSGRSCRGIIIMSRPDFVARRKSDNSLAIMDWKTSQYSLSTKEFEHKVQIAVGSLGVGRRLGEEVTHYWLIGLIKGQRRFLSREEEEGGFKKQITPICYPWVKEMDPPFEGRDIQFSGTTRKGYRRVPAWELGFSAMDWMLSQVPSEVSEPLIQAVGPFGIPRELGGFLEQIKVGGLEWEARVANVQAGYSLDSQIFQTWDCLPYGPNYPACSFLGICKGWEGMRDPLESGFFRERDGNHELEKEWLESK